MGKEEKPDKHRKLKIAGKIIAGAAVTAGLAYLGHKYYTRNNSYGGGGRRLGGELSRRPLQMEDMSVLHNVSSKPSMSSGASRGSKPNYSTSIIEAAKPKYATRGGEIKHAKIVNDYTLNIPQRRRGNTIRHKTY